MVRIPERTIINFNQKTQDEYDNLKNQRRELTARMYQANVEIEQAKTNLGTMVAQGCDYGEYTENLEDLRKEHEALKLGIQHIKGEMSLMKSSNSWLRD